MKKYPEFFTFVLMLSVPLHSFGMESGILSNEKMTGKSQETSLQLPSSEISVSFKNEFEKLYPLYRMETRKTLKKTKYFYKSLSHILEDCELTYCSYKYSDIKNDVINVTRETIKNKESKKDMYNFFSQYKIPVAQASEGSGEIKSFFHPAVLSWFSLKTQEQLKTTKTQVMNFKNIADFDGLDKQKKKMLTLGIIALCAEELSQDCDQRYKYVASFHEMVRTPSLDEVNKIVKVIKIGSVLRDMNQSCIGIPVDDDQEPVDFGCPVQ